MFDRSNKNEDSEILNTSSVSVCFLSVPVLRGWWSAGWTVCNLSSFISRGTEESIEQRQEPEASMFSAVCRYFTSTQTRWKGVKPFVRSFSLMLTPSSRSSLDSETDRAAFKKQNPLTLIMKLCRLKWNESETLKLWFYLGSEHRLSEMTF